ncbi:C/D box methylation guide ribonucleoprotein complex aNOP56 subunit, partial [Candidatus Bathyarchaeota archaeon]|nr:C/D box methylation guide ribonucleoprotein complex aNOP56 subunit [Candidatus Bathyarchaeota archaeon]NIR13838.1 C/D box methylation guide ribonucleoprotein complex aNOP56 subunit [Desulfobacterales bacterium]NIU80831.1 C/D box methylation guide ribonucleoprotein complex aNOP56 subunit [Candidatus Bathyarchaeota archaeon]NIV68393.1 C/D box methylation guide ribonucleoprotein complex aNOP56 subunit [Candidatus Bathyarchaeota archaeon]NIW16227.1 C/D box methylation guide ribonucleoprotein com
MPEDRAEKIAKAAQKSMGAALSEEDVEQIEALSRNILGFYDTRRSLETYIDSVMEAVAP